MVDWFSVDGLGDNYTSFLTSAYRIKGAAQHRFQTNYIYIYSNNVVNTSYKLQGIWSYAVSPNSGKYTNLERTDILDSTINFNNVFRRHRIRGRGVVNQFRIQSVDNTPFNFIGWSVEDKVNQGV